MPATIDAPQVSQVLDRLHAQAETEDEQARQRVLAREAEVGERLAPSQRYELYGDAPLSITAEVGRLYYLLATARRAKSIVEFGASHGISTIYLAAALRDLGGGRLITTEILPRKALWAARNLDDAGLADLVEIRVGDALEILRELPPQVDLLVLDGRNDQYVGVLEIVRDRLSPGAVVIADLGKDDPDLQAYQRHVRDSVSGFDSMSLPLDAGIEVAVLRSYE
ncbi:MAG TPA: class I SAM-dependent methyltransferase [Solirubrobacterales bacterium]|nr:class I SAM-dependent methyltransferase [Solirubrobacterales bacterium]